MVYKIFVLKEIASSLIIPSTTIQEIYISTTFSLNIDYWSSKFLEISFSHTIRDCNKAVHNLAKYGCIFHDFYSYSQKPPSWMSEQLGSFSELIKFIFDEKKTFSLYILIT